VQKINSTEQTHR